MAKNQKPGLGIRKGDTVQVMSGKDRGLTGTVLSVDVEKRRVVVEGVNRITRHIKPGRYKKNNASGGIITAESSIDISNVAIVDPSDNRPTRIGFRRVEVQKRRADGTTYPATRAIRVSRRTGTEL